MATRLHGIAMTAAQTVSQQKPRSGCVDSHPVSSLRHPADSAPPSCGCRTATFGVVQGQAAHEYLQLSVDPMIQRLKPRMQVFDSMEAGDPSICTPATLSALPEVAPSG